MRGDMMEDVAILGGAVFYDQISRLVGNEFADVYRVIGAVDDELDAGAELSGGGKCIGGWSEFCAAHDARSVRLILGVGYRDLEARLGLLTRARSAGYRLASLISPRAMVAADAQCDEGAIVMAGAVIDVGANVGAAAFIDIGVNIGEGAAIGDASYVSAGAAIGGRAVIGRANFIGLNAVVVDGVTTGDFVRLQAGALLHRDAPARAAVMEARAIRIIPSAAEQEPAA